MNGLAVAETAARKAGALLADRFAKARVVSEISRDIKLAEDGEAEAVIVDILKGSGIPILAEESASAEDALGADAIWVADPLDGSFNFERGFDRCAVSIGLLKKGRPVGGVLYDFMRDELYVGGADQRALCNGEPISVSSVTAPSRAALATGLPVNRDYSDVALAAFSKRLARFKKVRMIGSAASSLLLVARGVFDIYEEEDIMLWDIAAGVALVEAAGGATRMSPSQQKPNAVTVQAAASSDLF